MDSIWCGFGAALVSIRIHFGLGLDLNWVTIHARPVLVPMNQYDPKKVDMVSRSLMLNRSWGLF